MYWWREFARRQLYARTDLSSVFTLADIERLGRQRLAPFVQHYFSFTAGPLQAVANRAAFDRVLLRPRAMAGDLAQLDLRVNVLNTECDLPIMVCVHPDSPTCMHACAHVRSRRLRSTASPIPTARSPPLEPPLPYTLARTNAMACHRTPRHASPRLATRTGREMERA